MERERVFQFLVGLNLEFDQASGQVLGREPFPSMDEAFAQVRWEECSKELMVGNYRNPIPENSALAVSKPLSIAGKYMREGKRMVDTDKLWCDYCHKPRHLPRHTKEMCSKLHGKPQNLKGVGNKGGHHTPKSGEAHQTTAVEDSQEATMFSQSDIEKLRKLLNQFENQTSESVPKSSSCSMAQSGNSYVLVISKNDYLATWIIDLGASDHMIGS